MRIHTRSVVVFLVAVVVSATVLRICLVPRKLALTRSELTLGRMPLPIQPTAGTLECTGGHVVNTSQYFLDHLPCNIPEIVLPPVKATPAEMLELTRRPQVVFQIAANGQVSNSSISRTSGSKTLDEKSLKQVMASRYRRHNCGVCRVSTTINVDFQGPVWIPESTQ